MTSLNREQYLSYVERQLTISRTAFAMVALSLQGAKDLRVQVEEHGLDYWAALVVAVYKAHGVDCRLEDVHPDERTLVKNIVFLNKYSEILETKWAVEGDPGD